MNFKINVTLGTFKNAEQIKKELGLEKFGRVQRFVDTEVVRLCDKYVPLRTGTLKKANGTVYGSGTVRYNTPYAKSNYYNNAGRGSGGTAYGGFRGRLWLERMKAAMGDYFTRKVKQVARAAKAIWRG